MHLVMPFLLMANGLSCKNLIIWSFLSVLSTESAVAVGWPSAVVEACCWKIKSSRSTSSSSVSSSGALKTSSVTSVLSEACDASTPPAAIFISLPNEKNLFGGATAFY